MKSLHSISEYVWVEAIKSVPLTESQIELLSSNDPSKKEERKQLISSLSKPYKEATNEDALLANSIYENNKPSLSPENVYSFISMDLYINENKTSGILNCRIDGEHIQIRI